VERVEGRQRRTRWGPRTLDVDILLYGREAIDVPGLTVPHPRMLERSFVLVPLLEAWPDARMPDGTIPSVRSRASTDEHMTRLAAELRGPSGRREVTTVG
jgi:2-amino-4-hydroxy-6-hydroxymethyldihydropteridine diphosphokinase